MYERAKYLAAGDCGILIEFGNAILPEISAKVRAMTLAIETSKISAIVAFTPTYRSILLQYDPLKMRYAALLEVLQKLETELTEMQLPAPRIFEVPTCYGGSFGPDLDFVCEHTALNAEEVIAIHTAHPYLVYMLGFTPGFSYLGGMDERIATPRLKTPRAKIPGGSVGIAAKQTGIYSIDSPGGWQLIGKTPILLYDPYRMPPILHGAGDYIKFVRIDEPTYAEIEKQVTDGSYSYRLYPMEGGKDHA